MNNNKIGKYIALYLLIFGLFFSCNSQSAEITKPVSDEGSKHFAVKSVPEFQLPVPLIEADKTYLGILENNDFNLGQIKAKLLIIEFFSFYCPHCQKAASKVNELYQKIEQQSSIQGKIKIIGIGVANSNYEINSFKNKYEVPFPLFSDKSSEIFNLFHARVTPTFIGIKINENGSFEQFYFKEGGFEDSQQFLSEVIKLSGMEAGDKNEPTD